MMNVPGGSPHAVHVRNYRVCDVPLVAAVVVVALFPGAYHPQMTD